MLSSLRLHIKLFIISNFVVISRSSSSVLNSNELSRIIESILPYILFVVLVIVWLTNSLPSKTDEEINNDVIEVEIRPLNTDYNKKGTSGKYNSEYGVFYGEVYLGKLPEGEIKKGSANLQALKEALYEANKEYMSSKYKTKVICSTVLTLLIRLGSNKSLSALSSPRK